MIEKELYEVINNRAFRMSIITQVFLVFVMVYLYKTYSSIDQYKIPITVSVNENDPALVQALEDNGVTVVVRPTANSSNSSGASSAQASRPRGSNEVAQIDVNSKEIKSDSSNILTSIAIARIKVASRVKSLDDLLAENNFTFKVQGSQDNNDFAQMAYGLIIPLVIMFPAIVSMTLASQGLLIEKKKRTIELFLVSPISDFSIAIAKILPLSVASLLTSVILLLVASNDIVIKNQLILIVVSCLVAIAATSLGIVISTFSKTVREANALSAIVAIMSVAVIVIPTPLSLYMPHTTAARAAVTSLDEPILLGMFFSLFLAVLSFAVAFYSVARMRKNYY